MTPSVLVIDGVCYPWRAKWRRISGLGIAHVGATVPLMFFVDNENAKDHVDALVAGADFCAVEPVGKKTFAVRTVANGKIYTSLDCFWTAGPVIEIARAFKFPAENEDLMRLTREALS